MAKIVVTGGTGFLGKNLQALIEGQSCEDEYIFIGSDYELRNVDECHDLFYEFRPTKIIHLAGVVGGIKANSENQYKFFIDNLRINSNLIDSAIEFNTSHLLLLSSVCVYPRELPEKRYPLTLSDVFDGPPEFTNAGYAHAKRAMQAQVDAARKSFPNFKACVVYPANLYGPFDHFGEKGAHVIPDLIHKIHNAKINEKPFVELYGTGNSLRQFTYAPSLAKLLQSLSESRADYDLNYFSSPNISIKALAAWIKVIIGYGGELRFNGELDGQHRRDVELTTVNIPVSRVPLEYGLMSTYQWYLNEFTNNNNAGL